MSHRGHDFMVGLTAIIGIVGLAAILVLFGWLPEFLDEGYVVRVEMTDATGLSSGSRVKMRGIDIGQVKRVDLAPDSEKGVMAVLMIEKDRLIPQGTIARGESKLLGGQLALKLLPPALVDASAQKAGPGEFLKTDGSAVISGQISSMTDGLAKQMKQAVSGMSGRFEELNKHFDRMASAAEKLGGEWTKVGAHVNTLIKPHDPDAQGDQPGNLSTLLAKTNERMAELGKVIGDIKQLVGDPQLRADIRATASNARKFTEKLNTSADNVNALTEDARKKLDTLSARYAQLADNLTSTATVMRSAIVKADQGKGTVGKMLNDPALYDNLNDSVERIGAAVSEFKMLMEKWNKEGLPLKLK